MPAGEAVFTTDLRPHSTFCDYLFKTLKILRLAKRGVHLDHRTFGDVDIGDGSAAECHGPVANASDYAISFFDEGRRLRERGR